MLSLPRLDTVVLGGLYFPKPLSRLVFGTPASQTRVKIEFWYFPEKLVHEFIVLGKGLVANTRIADIRVQHTQERLDAVGFLHLLLCPPSSPLIRVCLPGAWWKQLTKVFHKRMERESKLNSKLAEVVVLCLGTFYVGPLAAEVGRSSTVTCLDKSIYHGGCGTGLRGLYKRDAMLNKFWSEKTVGGLVTHFHTY